MEHLHQGGKRAGSEERRQRRGSSVTEESEGVAQDLPPTQSSSDTTISTPNLYATLGLSPEDVNTLAQIPENEISVETLPGLIMQLKARRAERNQQVEQSFTKEKESDVPEKDRKDCSLSDKPLRSASKSPVPSRTANYKCNKYDSQERLEPARSKREASYSRSSHDKAYFRSSLKFPQSYQVDDFHGILPKSFPHTCSLCYCMLNSSVTWRDHLNGLRHKDGRRDLLRLYPDWDPHESPRRIPEAYQGDDETSVFRRGVRLSVPHRRPYSAEQSAGERLPHPLDSRPHRKPKAGTKVVVAKFPLGSVSVEDLVNLAKPFGTVVKHLVFPYKGFLELSTHKEAASMVDYYTAKPAFVKDNRLNLYLSPMVGSIHTPKAEKAEKAEKRSKHVSCAVVWFSHLPPGKETESEVVELGKMFGEVRDCKFTDGEAFIEMVDWKDAEVMVKYYRSNPLKINGKNVRISLSSHKQMRSPKSASYEKGDANRTNGSEEHSRSSHCRSKESASLLRDVSENKDLGASENRTKVHGKEECLNMEEDEQGISVEDEQHIFEDDFCQDRKVSEEHNPSVDVDVTAKERLEDLIEVKAKVSEKTEVSPHFIPLNVEEKENDSPPSPTSTKPLTPVESSDIAAEEAMEQGGFHEDEDMDYPENIDEFITVDELYNDTETSSPFDSMESSEVYENKKAGKVVIIRHIRKGYGLKQALFELAEPFGKVTNHAMSFYRQEALMEMESEEAANKMVEFYKGSNKAQIFGRPVSVEMCLTVQKLEGPSGRSVYIGMLPLQKYSDVSLLRLAQPFGKISAYHLNWRHRKCYIQMETVEAAQKMVQKYFVRPPKFYGSVLRICQCRKGDSQIPWKPPVKFELWCAQQKRRSIYDEGIDVGEDEDSQTTKSPAVQKSENEEGIQSSGLNSGDLAPAEKCRDVSVSEEDAEQKVEMNPGRLGPYQPNNPIGLDYVVQRTCFFCKLCEMFYTNEKDAKFVHCSSFVHYQNLKKKLEDGKDSSVEASNEANVDVDKNE